MKKSLLITAVVVLLAFVAYIDTPEDTYHGFRTDLHEDLTTVNTETEESKETFGQAGEESVEVFSTVTHELEDSFERDGYVIEKYREYELFENEDGVIVKKIPTSNYEFLRYKKDEN